MFSFVYSDTVKLFERQLWAFICTTCSSVLIIISMPVPLHLGVSKERYKWIPIKEKRCDMRTSLKLSINWLDITLSPLALYTVSVSWLMIMAEPHWNRLLPQYLRWELSHSWWHSLKADLFPLIQTGLQNRDIEEKVQGEWKYEREKREFAAQASQGNWKKMMK